MEDTQIIDLYFARSARAIQETDSAYGGYCYSIAYNILASADDARECIRDTYCAAWNAMPPRRPGALGAFLGKITRHISIDRWRKYRTFKQGQGQIEAALEELRQCVSGGGGPRSNADRQQTLQCLNRFLGTLKDTERGMFLCRYWYLDSAEEIAEKSGISIKRVRAILGRLRRRLNTQLEKEGLR